MNNLYYRKYLELNRQWLDQCGHIKAFCSHFHKLHTHSERLRFFRYVCEQRLKLYNIEKKIKTVIEEWEGLQCGTI